MNNRKKKLEGIFHAVSELSSPGERENYLQEACAGDAELRCEVEALLNAAPTGDELFRACDRGSRQFGTISSAPIAEQAGSLIGRYKLLEIIGEGGMGVVYMAEQEQPVRRKVAIKIIKLGMDTRQVVARFEAERQALAMMDHPHIAQVLDAGATDTGRPYFVMELVQGVPITEFCAANRISVDERIKLFMAVCQAIQSAHQKGIIHRDIKPSNVLVTLHNGVAHPMVIDFGVAKAIDQKLTEKTFFTNFATMIGTPAYMSPEQAEMSKLDVDTRSDIYSLGVLLYELLTGSTPFPEERLRSVAYGEMQRIIAEEEPERPSTRLKKTALAGSTSNLTTRHSSLATDLDWIVMKCLEKDRARRYETASGLAADILRHLNDEPVVARPPGAIYQLRKLVRRHKLPFAAVTTLALVLIVSGWQAARMDRERRLTKEQTEVARVVKEFLTEQLMAVNPYVEPEPNPYRRFQVERVARVIEGKFTKQPLVEAEMRSALAWAFAGIGDHHGAAMQAKKALEIRRRELGETHSDTLESYAGLATAYVNIGRRRDAESLLATALATVSTLPPDLSAGAANVLSAQASLFSKYNRPLDALPYLQRAMPVLKRIAQPKDFRFKDQFWEFAYVTTEARQWREAERLWNKGVAECETDYGSEHPMTAQFRKGQSYFFLQRGRSQEALTNLESIIPIYHRVLGTNHHNGLDAEGLLARAYEQQGRTNDAAQIYRSLHPRWATYLPYAPARLHCGNMAQFFKNHRLYEDAKAAYRALAASWETDPPETSVHLETFIEATAAAKGWPAAASICRKYLDDFADDISVWRTKATVFLYSGDINRYRRVLTKVLALAPAARTRKERTDILNVALLGAAEFSPEQVSQCEALIRELERGETTTTEQEQNVNIRAIGGILFRLGRLSNSLDHLDRAVQKYPSGTSRARVLVLKTLCLHGLGRLDQAHTAFDEAEDLMRVSLLERLNECEHFLTLDERTYLILRREAQALLAAK
jgi:tetratricopeptide (TPR) repeat protein